MYIYHLISIDLELSRSFNTYTAKLTVISPARTPGLPTVLHLIYTFSAY
jgi:hypothetical protein